MSGYGKHNYEIGPWALEKLQLLEDYLPRFQMACKSALDCIYIDAFAGRGQWRLKHTDTLVNGSPKIALKYLDGFSQVHLIEYDYERVKELELLRKTCSNPTKVHIYHGDANQVIPEIMGRIHKKAPCFVFLDPSRDQLKWTTIRTLSQWKTELYILYPLHMAILRLMQRDGISVANVARLNDFFGCNDWKPIFDENTAGFRRRLPEKLLVFYEARLRDLGYNFRDTSECFRGEERQKLYYMLWVGKHPLGDKLIKHIRQMRIPYVQQRLEI